MAKSRDLALRGIRLAGEDVQGRRGEPKAQNVHIVQQYCLDEDEYDDLGCTIMQTGRQ